MPHSLSYLSSHYDICVHTFLLSIHCYHSLLTPSRQKHKKICSETDKVSKPNPDPPLPQSPHPSLPTPPPAPEHAQSNHRQHKRSRHWNRHHILLITHHWFLLRHQIDHWSTPNLTLGPELEGHPYTGDKSQCSRWEHCKYTERKWTEYLRCTLPGYHESIQNFPSWFLCSVSAGETASTFKVFPVM